MIFVAVFLAAANVPVADDPSGRVLTSLDFDWRVNVTYAVPKPHHDQNPTVTPVNNSSRSKIRRCPYRAIQPSLRSLDLLKDYPWAMPRAWHAELADAHAVPMH